MTRICGLFFVVMSTAAHALTTYPGCAEPPSSAGRHSFYVDPEKGDKANDGSAERPWRTLAEVLDPANHLVATQSYLRYAAGDRSLSAVNPDGPIKPGDVIYLMSGDHGSPVLKGYFNDAFITVEAAPDQKPVVGQFKIAGASHWIFRGLKFQGAGVATAPYEPLVNVGFNDNWGLTDNIIFDSNTMTTEDDTASWTDVDWAKKPYYLALNTNAVCTTLFNNHFINVRTGIGIGWTASKTNVQGNLIEHFGADGIDTTASDVTIRGNIIRYGQHTPSEPDHPDGIQGWTAKDATNRNVIIDANTIVNTPSFGDLLQGISIFDGKWDGLVVSNNVVITNAWHGIALYGVANALVVNNTVAPSNPQRFPTWIMVHDSKDKTHSRNVVVRNNISAQLLISGDNVTIDHNIAQNTIAIPGGNKSKYYKKGAVGVGNVVEPSIYLTLTKVDNASSVYDLRPKADSRAIEAGNSDRAPPVDITGKPRVAPIDIGAYEH